MGPISKLARQAAGMPEDDQLFGGAGDDGQSPSQFGPGSWWSSTKIGMEPAPLAGEQHYPTFNDTFFGKNATPGLVRPGNEDRMSAAGFGDMSSGQPYTTGPVGKAAWGGGIPGSGPPASMTFGHNGQDYDMSEVDPRYRDAAEKAIMLGRTDWLRGAKPIQNRPTLGNLPR